MVEDRAQAPDSPSGPSASTALRGVVGVGASAGGLEALGRFFSQARPGVGLAYVVVQHLSPDHRSFMVELLTPRTSLKVRLAEDGAELVPDFVYLLPPGQRVRIFGGRLTLSPVPAERSHSYPIDDFFRSLALDREAGAMAVVLSGTGSDGTQGVRAIKEAGGLVLVQTEASAEFDGMPRNAIGTGVADLVALPEELPGALERLLNHRADVRMAEGDAGGAGRENALRRIFAVIREQHGVDFSQYKASTVERRIERRMSLQQLTVLGEYATVVEGTPDEARLLHDSLLICVTQFFRDPEVWERLAHDALARLGEAIPEGGTIRAWVAGCSTGEEAYTLAILLDELVERRRAGLDFKVFATDVSKGALDQAGLGIYPESTMESVPADRLARCFIRRTEGYQIAPRLRRKVVFARHDLLRDPPLSRMDIICCRNLLIYLQAPAQLRVLQGFHHALSPGALLVLGSSESLGDALELFTVVEPRLKILRQRPGARSGFLSGGGALGPLRDRSMSLGSRVARLADGRTTLELIQKEIIRQFAPACLVVDENRELLHVFGRAGEYLRHPDGATTQNVLHLTAHSIGPALGPALHRVERDGGEFVYDNVRFRLADGDRVARVRVRVLGQEGRSGRLFLAAVEEVEEPGSRAGAVEDFQVDQAAARRIHELEQELGFARETLQATIEELETSNEELQASNEELLASNEELQSTNEELQSVNEELHSVNAEHQARIADLVALSNDLGNIFASAHVGACLLDHDLRFRKLAAGVFPLTGLRPGDVGAPVEVLARSLEAPAIVTMVQRVSTEGGKEELEVSTPQGALLLLRAVPYADESGGRDGVVLTIVDLTERLRTQRRLATSEAALRSILDSVPAHVALVDATGRIVRTNAAWKRFAQSNGGLGALCGEGANYFDVCRQVTGTTAVEAQEVLASLMGVLRGSLPRYERRYACPAPDEPRWFLLSAERIETPEPGLVISHARLLEALPAG